MRPLLNVATLAKAHAGDLGIRRLARPKNGVSVPRREWMLPSSNWRAAWMSRTLTLLFRRDPSRDRQTEQCNFEGYHVLWPDGQPVAIGVEAFCKHGMRLFGLGKYLAHCDEKLVKLIYFPLDGRDDDLNRNPGHRV